MATEPKKEQQSLPEEKLLKVIQGKGPSAKAGPATSDTKTLETAPAAASRPAAPAAKASPAPKAPSAAAPESPDKAKPALKVNRAAKDTAAAKTRPAAKLDAAKSSFQPVPNGRRAGSGVTITMVNRVLGAIVGAFVLLTAWEVVGAVKSLKSGKEPAVVPEGARPMPESQGSTNTETNVAQLDIDIFQPPPSFVQPLPTGTVVVVEWQAYAKENLNMIGLSGAPETPGREAILFDKSEKKMHVLKVGQKITLVQREVIVDSIGGEEVVLSDGKQKITLK